MSSHLTAPAPAWTIPDYLEARNDQLHINGANSLDLISAYGSPLYVFSEPRIRANIARLQGAAAAVDRPVKFCYASKANSNMAVLAAVRAAGIDLEVNSGGELFKALRADFRPDQIIFNGTSKTDDELDEAVRAGIYSINVDSVYEIELVEAAALRMGKRANITLRLVPEIGTRSHIGLQTALLTSKFGITSSEVPDAFRRALEHPELIRVAGIHIHIGSQTPDVEPFAAAFKTMWEHLLALYQRRDTRSNISISAAASRSIICATARRPTNSRHTNATCSARVSNPRKCWPQPFVSRARRRARPMPNISGSRHDIARTRSQRYRRCGSRPDDRAQHQAQAGDRRCVAPDGCRFQSAALDDDLQMVLPSHRRLTRRSRA
jgi:hypothetical protein